ncbi:putative ferric-chelate reductase 1 [Ixodes scapularis]|uniref:putative ferric-chelate reductase 1 n=1 Tax=Ixodes scapularis TaxID=6945 RepID=UPI001AD61A49|nr:putative ferric-chelate reductase 1 [Ixodes scapularis]
MWAARVAVCLITLSPPPRWAHRKGAPVTTCNEMEPRHDKEVMHSHHYYQIVVDRLQGEQLRVTLMALNNQTSFRGFLIRAMRVQGSSLAYHGGRFEKDAAYPNVQFIACDGVENSAATHVGPNEKRQISVTWRPRERSPDIVRIFFRATVVQNYATFWMKLDTERILIGAATPTGGRHATVALSFATFLLSIDSSG